MLDSNERFRKMSSLAQIGWWEADFLTGHFVCSEFLADLFGLDNDMISFEDFHKLVCEDYRSEDFTEFRSSIIKDFYERVFPVHSKQGVVWGRARLGGSEINPVTKEKLSSYGSFQLIDDPGRSPDSDFHNVNNLLSHQKSISQSLLRFLEDENVENCVDNILKDILKHYQAERAYIFEFDKEHTYHYCTHEVLSSKDISAEKDNLQYTMVDESPWWCNHILSGQPIILDTINQLPAEAASEYEILARQNIKSLMVVPLTNCDSVWGYMGLDLVKSYHVWSNNDYQWFLSLANIISICLELRKAKDNVIREKQFLYNLFRYMPLGYIHMFVIRDKEGVPCDYRILDANQICLDIFGRFSGNFVGRLASEIYEDPKKKVDFILDILDKGIYKEMDEYVEENEIYSHWIVYSPEKDEVVGLFINLAENVKASRAMDRSEKLFKNVFANIPVGVEIYDKNGTLTDLNNKDMEIFGIVKKSDVLGVNLFSNPNINPELRKRIREEDMVDFSMNYQFKNINGVYYNSQKSTGIDLYTKICKWYDNQGVFNGYVFLNIDNTERFDSLNRIRDFENFFSFISDYAKVGYCKLNLADMKGYAIKQWFKNLGEDENTPLSEIVGVYSKLHPDDRIKALEFICNVINGTEKNFQRDVRVMRNGKDERWNWLSMNMIVTNYDPEQNIIELIGINYDITELKETEAELVIARDEAQAMDRLKSAFVANMSHEIRTPLNAIVGFSNLLVDTDDIEERRKYIKIVQENNDLLLQLISDILDLSKIEAGMFDFTFDNVDANKLCQEIVYSLQIKTSENVNLVFDDNEQECYLRSDKNRLYQVLSNFVNNAIKFTHEGSIHVGYEIKGEHIEFYVSDTGVGIERERQSQIFERFVKLDHFVNGTGLGLSICKSIVEQLGGRIGVDSEPGKGSRFWFTHPYVIPLQNKEDSMTVSQSNEINNMVVRKDNPVVLVAEDTRSNYLLIFSILRKDYTVEWAHDGLEAVQMCKELSPDIILMDIRMPVMDGLEATRKIREFNSTIPILAVTAFAFESDKEKAREAGCSGFITKPISVSLLKEQIKNALNGIL